MNKYRQGLIAILRVAFGWLFFYAGVTKVIDPGWSAAFYLKDAHTLTGFYTWLLQPEILPWVNFLNAWGLTLIGLSLLVGYGVKYSAPLGAVIMILYYLPALNFPYVGEHSFLVDEHIIYAFGLLLLAALRAGKHWGVDGYLKNRVS